MRDGVRCPTLQGFDINDSLLDPDASEVGIRIQDLKI